MDRNTAVAEIEDLQKRLTTIIGAAGTGDQESDWEALKNDVEEFKHRAFVPGSADYSKLTRGPVIRSVGTSREWEHKKDAEWMEKAFALVLHRLKAGQSEMVEGETNEVVVEAGTPHSAYVKLREIVSQATTALTIVDPWVGTELFPLLTNVDSTASIRILCKADTLPKDFGAEAKKFSKEHGVAIEVRTGLTDWHDRFLIVDDRVFHSGASFKDVGKKVSYVAEITSVAGTIISEVEKRWKSSNLV